MPTLDETIKARDDFLNQKPHLKAYQDELDRILDKVPEHQRLEVIYQMAAERMQELRAQLGRLHEELDNVETD